LGVERKDFCLEYNIDNNNQILILCIKEIMM
jgi:hypothetical protein